MYIFSRCFKTSKRSLKHNSFSPARSSPNTFLRVLVNFPSTHLIRRKLRKRAACFIQKPIPGSINSIRAHMVALQIAMGFANSLRINCPAAPLPNQKQSHTARKSRSHGWSFSAAEGSVIRIRNMLNKAAKHTHISTLTAFCLGCCFNWDEGLPSASPAGRNNLYK